MEARTFFLLEIALGVSGDFLVKGVACQECNFEAETCDSNEREKLIEASSIWRTREEGNITLERATELLDGLQSQLLAKITEEGKTWVCAGCGGQNPMSFLECWRCQRQREIAS